MNENLNLVEILKDCPKGTKLYSTLFGDVEFERVCKNEKTIFPIEVKRSDDTIVTFMTNGRFYFGYSGECTLFPSRDQRDWSKFKVNKPRFDSKTLQAFDRVLVRNENYQVWQCDLFSHIKNGGIQFMYRCVSSSHKCCIPYNDETKHLVGTKEEAPEYYRYWED